MSSEFALELIRTLFGPNPLAKLAMRRNQDLLKMLTERLSAEQVDGLLEDLTEQFNSPNV